MAILGVWMWPRSIEQHGAEKTVSCCLRAGITDIFFLTKGLKGEASYPSAYAPASCERDLLGELIAAAHPAGIRIHAWFTSASDEHYKKLHPESGRCHYIRGKDKEFISLADEGYLDYMKKIVREACRNYAIDGIHLDYIRYNHLLYGWAEEDLQRYAAAEVDVDHIRSLINQTFYGEDGKDPDSIFNAFRSGDKNVLALAHVRRKDVVRFAEELIEAARTERKDLIISAALMPEGAYDDTAFSDLHYGQNYADASRLYDWVLPMAYSKAYGENGKWVRKVAEGSIRRGLRTIVGLHAYEGGTSSSLKEDISCLDGAAVDGICLFRAGSFAFIFCEGKQITLYNATNKPITKTMIYHGATSICMEESIAAGEEKHLSLSFEPDGFRIFSNEEEICAFHTTSHTAN